jgi:hypothetical protein
MRAFVFCFLAACGASQSVVTHPHTNASAHVELDRFLADEDHVLSLLAAADARIAQRGITPDPVTLHHVVMGGVLAEDQTMDMEGDRPDVFSFDVRSRALDAAMAIVDKWKVPPESGATLARPDLELELLHRMVASEKLRLVGERDLPRSASVLLGALASTWRVPDVKDAQTHDDWLARRIGQVTASLAPQSLTLTERDDLDDSLDPLEHAMEGMTKSSAALVALRLAVQRVDVAARPRDRWDAIALRLAADDGTELSADTLLALLVTEAKLLKSEIDALVGAKIDDEIATRAAESLAKIGACETKSVMASRVRALQPPPERAFDCAIRERLIAAHASNEVLDVLLAMHDAVVCASWAVITARGGDATTIALAAPKLLAPLPPTAEGRLARFAATRPIVAITRALSVEWIMRNGLGEAVMRAEGWRAFGDAPIDVIDRELHPHARDHAHQTTRDVR